jgi:hypothetical protein
MGIMGDKPMPDSAETLRALTVEHNSRAKQFYDACAHERKTYKAANADNNEDTATAWDAAVDAKEAAEAHLNELDNEIEKAGWGEAMSYHICGDGLTEEDIAYYVMKHDVASRSALRS